MTYGAYVDIDPQQGLQLIIVYNYKSALIVAMLMSRFEGFRDYVWEIDNRFLILDHKVTFSSYGD